MTIIRTRRRSGIDRERLLRLSLIMRSGRSTSERRHGSLWRSTTLSTLISSKTSSTSYPSIGFVKRLWVVSSNSKLVYNLDSRPAFRSNPITRLKEYYMREKLARSLPTSRATSTLIQLPLMTSNSGTGLKNTPRSLSNSSRRVSTMPTKISLSATNT